MANSMSVDGTDLSAYGLYVTRGTLPGMPDAEENVRIIGQMDGGVSSPRTYSPRQIVTEVVISAASYALMLTAIDNVKKVLMPREDVEVKWDRWTDRYYLGRSTLRDIALEGPTFARGEIVTACADPFAYAVTESTQTETIDTSTGGVSVTITGAGTSIAYPVILLEATGTRTGVVIEHDALDTRITYSGQLVSGDKIRINCNPTDWLVEKMPTGQDAYVAVMDSIDGQFPHIEVGDNTFTVYWFTGDVTWTWRERYA